MVENAINNENNTIIWLQSILSRDSFPPFQNLATFSTSYKKDMT